MTITTEVTEPSGEITGIDHNVWISREANKMGFPIAGTIRDLYLDAVVLIAPMWAWDWNKDKVKIGRVIHLIKSAGEVWDFVLQLEDGTQVPCMYGLAYSCYFALPEDTEDFAR